MKAKVHAIFLPKYSRKSTFHGQAWVTDDQAGLGKNGPGKNSPGKNGPEKTVRGIIGLVVESVKTVP